MARAVAVLNVGSSSIKGDLFEIDTSREPSVRARVKRQEVTDFDEAIASSLDDLLARANLSGREAIRALGHRVVHGGPHATSAVEIDDRVLDTLRANVGLAPLHNPPAIHGIEIARRAFPTIPHYAVFDTAFHTTMPEHVRRYAVSRRLHEELGVRRYGFHGTSHSFVARRAAEILARPLAELRLVTLHLGNGASAAAIRFGESIDTSMGMTPLEGLVMGTRPGDLDPAVPLLLARHGFSADAIEDELHHQSGLRGLTGESDMREIARRAAVGDEDAQLARAMVVHRIKKYVGGYLAILGGLDALVFTGGIGENDAALRASVCDGLEHLGIACDPTKNVGKPTHIGAGKVAVLVIPTDEELEIARHVQAMLDRA